MSLSSGGGKYVFDDDQEVPDTQVVTWEFPQACLVWEHRMWSTHGTENNGFGIAFYGDKGRSWMRKAGTSRTARRRKGSRPAARPPTSQNFLDCVHSRNKPNADIEIGHLSTRLCHLGNIAYRVGRKLTFDATREAFVNDPEADKLLVREYSSRFEMPSQV